MKRKILIIDDDTVTLKILRKYLEESYDVQTENSGVHFVDKIDSYETDMILLNPEMPGVEGNGLIEEIHDTPVFKDVPIVCLAGTYGEDFSGDNVLSKVDGFIARSSSKAELLDKIDNLLAGQKRKEASPQILVLDGDIKMLRDVRDTLEHDIYKVKTVRTVWEAVEYIKGHHTDLFVIGTDLMGYEPAKISSEIKEILRNERIRTLLMERPFFSTELAERVAKALE